MAASELGSVAAESLMAEVCLLAEAVERETAMAAERYDYWMNGGSSGDRGSLATAPGSF